MLKRRSRISRIMRAPLTFLTTYRIMRRPLHNGERVGLADAVTAAARLTWITTK